MTRSIYETSRDIARILSQTQQYAISRKLRKKVEMSFAHFKRILLKLFLPSWNWRKMRSDLRRSSHRKLEPLRKNSRKKGK
ncbi:MAG: hypothetical protein BA874_10705 [Desulfuromonadales bacterium C00003068]|nr:MAG: hypothetical protein BA874_10705 [Desulfuromonadales bacterium C00003068]